MFQVREQAVDCEQIISCMLIAREQKMIYQFTQLQ